METTASIRKHPIHPILVGIPIGLWVFSLICDLVYYFGLGGTEWESVALYTLGGGIVTALLAAIPGVIDLTSITDPKLKRIGIIHMIINLVVVLLYVINFALRQGATAPRLLPLILSLVGVGLLGVSGWLGGELVHVYGVSVAEDKRPGGTRPL
ncbi:MAG: hypothetical protein JWR69_3094 [Pedosphaera sp.]|nr:hypothetical protein [Pedosphaera sp.]